MELLLEQKEVRYLKLQRFVYVTLISLLFSSLEIFDNSMMFALPLFFLCFQCGYQEVLGYFIGIVISYFLFHTSYDVIIVSVGLFIVFEICLKIKYVRFNHLPYIICTVVGIYYCFNQNIYVALLSTLITYTNIQIVSQLPPLIIHGNHLLTHQRIRALNIVMLVTMASLLPYSSLISFALIRLYILITIFYLGIDDVMPAIFYVSIIILFSNLHYQGDVISLILPLFVYYMIKTHSKLMIVSLYLCSHLILPFFIEFSYTYHGLIIVSSALIFMFLPLEKNKKVVSISFEDTTLQNQLIKQIDSFSDLFHSMTTLFNETSLNSHVYEYVGYIYEDLCKDCSSHDNCFNSHYGPNRLVKLMNKGLKQDLNNEDKQFVENYCLEPELYLDLVKTYKKDFEKIQRIRSEYSTMKKELYRQFSLLTEVFSNFSQKLQLGEIEERHILEHLEGYHFQIEYLKKYYESKSTYYIEIGLYNIERKEIVQEMVPLLESYLNENLEVAAIKEPMHHLGYTYVLLKHCTKYRVEYGVTQFSKDPLICGDSYSLFQMPGLQYFSLSDGMGQGKKANEDSKLTLNIIKQLISNGISLNSAISSVNALLRIKNRNDMFTTLDMIEINLTNASSTIIKYGSCPTFIIRDDKIIEIEAKSLPMGIVSPLELSIQKTTLMENDLIFMITDGFNLPFVNMLNDYKMFFGDDHPQEIASFLMERALENEINDDLSLIVLRILRQR
ncbi:MAG: PP2C family serine/threonine-protein phosphatase [Bacilli bacterium]|nr:PP2C family serine/threonine-protein phosphatase [Bacilli bacterium]